MLLSLNINNFALIQSLKIDFEKGFNILCGETGSGKSIIIDAINFVLGGKFNKGLIRSGEEKAYVEGIFLVDNKDTISALREYNIDHEGMIIVSRESSIMGKTIARVNNRAVTLSQLRIITEKLLDIHGQHENIGLLDNSSHIHYLDSFGREKLNGYVGEYKELYSKYKEISNRIINLESNEIEINKKREFIKYQLEDISKAELRLGEDEELEEKYKALSNAEKLNKIVYECSNIIDGDGMDSKGIYNSITYVLRQLESIEQYSSKIRGIKESLEQVYYCIEDSGHSLNLMKDEFYYDESELNYINERLYTINSYKKKYGNKIEDIIKYMNKIQEEYENLNNSEEAICALKKEKDEILIQMEAIAGNIHKERLNLSEELSLKVKKELDYVGLEKSTFVISVEKQEGFNNLGKDKVTFLISTNPGEPLSALGEVVSGGELSRIMLAMKCIFFKRDNIPSVVFDEIDTGISGRTAQQVGEKMYQISIEHQVFCVTHLPQIASMADNIYEVKKEVINDRTYTIINKLEINQKINQIAKMTGGTEVTELTLKSSNEILGLAEKKKQEILRMVNNF